MTSCGPLTLCDSLAAPKQWKSGCVRTDYELRTDPLTWVTAREASASKNKRDSVEIDDTSVVNCERMEKKTKASSAFFQPDHSSASPVASVQLHKILTEVHLLCTPQLNFKQGSLFNPCILCDMATPILRVSLAVQLHKILSLYFFSNGDSPSFCGSVLQLCQICSLECHSSPNIFAQSSDLWEPPAQTEGVFKTADL